METGLLHDYLGNFSTWGERYYFHERWDWTHTKWDWNQHRKTWKLRKTQISFLGGGDLWWWYLGQGQEVQIGVGIVGAGGAMAGSQMGQGVGASSARWWGGREWQGQEGQMAVARGGGAGGSDSRVVGLEADGREPDGMGNGARRARWLGERRWHGAWGPDGSYWG